MAFPKLTKTKYPGIKYYKDKIKGKVYVAIFNINNKKYRKIVGYSNDQFKTNETIALIKKEDLKNEIIQNNYSKFIDPIFKDAWLDYIDHLKSSKSCAIKTIETKESVYRVHLKNKFENRKVKSITNLEVQKIANELLKKRAPKSVVNYISDLAAFFNYLIKHKIVKENPAKNIDLPKFDNEREYPLTVEESIRLFNTILTYEEPLYRGIFTFLLQGRRKEEVLNITWDNIELEKKTYTIKYHENKSRKNMTYEMTDELFNILNVIENKKGLVFKSPRTGQKLQNIRHAWTRIKSAAKIEKDMTIHELRHLLGYTLLNEADETEEVTAAVLGQTTKKATRRYAKVRQKRAAKGLKKAFEHLKYDKSLNDSRIDELLELGLEYKHEYESYVFKFINIGLVEIKTLSDKEWCKLIKDIKPLLK